MSSFFRNPGDDTSASEYDETSQSNIDASDGGLDRVWTLNSNTSADNIPQNFANLAIASSKHEPRDIITHALLERVSLNEAQAQIKRSTGRDHAEHDPNVQALGRKIYDRAVQDLDSHNVLSSAAGGEGARTMREGYRHALGLVMRSYSSNQLARSLPSSSNPVGTSPSSALIAYVEGTDPHLQLAALARHPLLEAGRYSKDFAELGILGQGGYGKVYRVKHQLDGQEYAVKKITLSSSRVSRVLQRGQDGFDALLKEVRTMARFDHPNIVRYYGGWLEVSAVGGQSRPVFKSFPSLLKAASEGEDGNHHQAQYQNNNSSKHDVVFGYSGEEVHSDGDHSFVVMEESAPSEHGSKASRNRRRRASNATVSSTISKNSSVFSIGEEEGLDEDVETIPRLENVPEASSINPVISTGGADDVIRPPVIPQPGDSIESSFTLHIQMSLHPMTLADFLRPRQHESAVPYHCFHPFVSLRLLLAIVDGVEYLHDQEVVHRDLKPTNIFLSICTKRHEHLGSVNVSSCSLCPKRNEYHDVRLKPRIGDFGLVYDLTQDDGHSKTRANMAADTSPATPTKAVGTELYRPTSSNKQPSAVLDVFALGVILFELLWPFGTTMERHQTLSDLKSAQLPENFAAKIGGGQCGVQLSQLITRMLNVDESEGPTCGDVRTTVEDILRLEEV